MLVKKQGGESCPAFWLTQVQNNFTLRRKVKRGKVTYHPSARAEPGHKNPFSQQLFISQSFNYSNPTYTKILPFEK